ncbi:MAG: hypothetical protein ACJ72E_16155 [Marmoricola sp.]
MDEKPREDEKDVAGYHPRRDGLADERDNPQLQPADDRELAQENAATSLDQPSGDIG